MRDDGSTLCHGSVGVQVECVVGMGRDAFANVKEALGELRLIRRVVAGDGVVLLCVFAEASTRHVMLRAASRLSAPTRTDETWSWLSWLWASWRGVSSAESCSPLRFDAGLPYFLALPPLQVADGRIAVLTLAVSDDNGVHCFHVPGFPL